MDSVLCLITGFYTGCIPINISILLLQAPPFTSNVYLGQDEISVSVGNLFNYITQLPNLLL